MDSQLLVAGGEQGLRAIAKAFRDEGVPIIAIYQIRLTSDEGYIESVVRLVTNRSAREIIHKHVHLQRQGKLPELGSRVRLDAVRPDDAEASRVLKYAASLGRTPIEIDGVMIDGMLIDYALVAEAPPSGVVAA